jgi:hypothetical protein
LIDAVQMKIIEKKDNAWKISIWNLLR